MIYTGGIDLGAGPMVSCTCVLTGIYVARFGNVIIPIMLVVGLAMGLLNGLLVTKLKLPSFIVTLCTTNFWSYIALTLCPNGSEIIPMDKRFMVKWATQKVAGIPVVFIIALLGILLLFIFQQYTVYGKSIYAVGANVSAARLAGVDTDKAQISAFVMSGACSACRAVLCIQAEVSGSHRGRRPYADCNRLGCTWRHLHGRRPGQRPQDPDRRGDHHRGNLWP